MLLILNICKIKAKNFNMNYKALHNLDLLAHLANINPIYLSDVVALNSKKGWMAGEYEGHLHANIFLLDVGNRGYEQFQEFSSEIFFTKMISKYFLKKVHLLVALQ